eukprot:CAMPEP_0184484036 /NCGR_PEP_ID=MMETSP0113_2-20130426/5733_1 /TAXON_ID=91329 /ORGANISM="Norrisiella sphaerica, Strain BC52" /LENGTH=238 /DNA_ID=CAMNT_0026864789 /DNA_START=364 /DNA_END=1080 /DNA_ORIENTATION=+
MSLDDHSHDSTIVDTLHPHLQDPTDMGNLLLTGKALIEACSADTSTLFLNMLMDIPTTRNRFLGDPINDVIQAIEKVGEGLRCLSMVECVVAKSTLATIARYGSSIGGLLLQCYNPSQSNRCRDRGERCEDPTDEDMANVLKSCPMLKFLWVDSLASPGFFGNKCWKSLEGGCCPLLQILWINSVKSTCAKRDISTAKPAFIRQILAGDNPLSRSLKFSMINPDSEYTSITSSPPDNS